jgi:protein involved in polysaccharide export with SLBB domain
LAYTKGARLERQINEMERLRMLEVFRKQREEAENNRLKEIAASNNASALSQLNTTETELQKFDIGNTYYVGIELDKALANPGGDEDVELREGDRIIVPQYNGTVKINGEVMYPNTVAYEKGKSTSYYIDQAGGFSSDAKKRNAYIIYMNGKVAKVSHKAKPQPGCEIVVPRKSRTRMSLAETISLGTGAASIATMIATIANVLK